MYEYEKKKLLSHVHSNTLDEALVNGNAIIAGGAITSLFTRGDVNDLDVYFRSREDLANFLQTIKSSCVRVLAHSDKAILLSDNGKQIVQAITFDFFETIDDIFDSFDFSVVMGAYDYANETFHFHDDFMKHNAQRLLKFNSGTSFPIMSALRVAKYEKKGFYISKAEFVRIVMQCMTLDISSYDDARAHIGGLYGLDMTSVIKDTNEFSIQDVIHQLSNISMETESAFDELSIQHRGDVFDWEDFVYEVTGIKNKVFLWGKTYLTRSGYMTIPKYKMEKSPEKYEMVDSPIDTSKVYKFVFKKTDKYFSYYDNDFEYKKGEFVYPKSKYDASLYFVFESGLTMATYSDRSDAVLIECDYDEGDIKKMSANINSMVTLKKARMIREIPNDERKILEDKWKSQINF